MEINKHPIARLAVIIPCLDEEEVLPTTIITLRRKLSELIANGEISHASRLIFVDDGSSDATWKIISENADGLLGGIRLTRHCGHQMALLAGMDEALDSCDICITIDADLQDDVEVFSEMLQAYREGADIVYGVRRDRHTDTWLKKSTAAAFYSTMRHLGVESINNHADFRLMSSRAMEDILGYEERNLFLRGIVPMLGYRQEKVFYDRVPRCGGKSKYPLKKMFDFAIDGITSFSVRPVRMLFWLGILFTLTAFGIGVYSLVRYFSGQTIEGWTSLMLSIWFCTGILLMGLGIIGEYIGKIYIEVKKRPRYKVADRV